MAFIETLSTGMGFWNPLIWLIAFIVATLIVYLIWVRGEKGYNKGTQQGTPYLSGNAAPSNEEVHIRAGNLYWGFTEALSCYYSRVVPLHTGILTDYLLWFLGTMAFVLIIMVVF